MKVNFKDLKGIRATPIKCDLCSRHFSRPQTLKWHVEKIHPADSTPSATDNQHQSNQSHQSEVVSADFNKNSENDEYEHLFKIVEELNKGSL